MTGMTITTTGTMIGTTDTLFFETPADFSAGVMCFV